MVNSLVDPRIVQICKVEFNKDQSEDQERTFNRNHAKGRSLQNQYKGISWNHQMFGRKLNTCKYNTIVFSISWPFIIYMYLIILNSFSLRSCNTKISSTRVSNLQESTRTMLSEPYKVLVLSEHVTPLHVYLIPGTW